MSSSAQQPVLGGGIEPLPPAQAYQRRVDSSKARLAALDRVGARIANGRVVTFLGALIFAGLSLFHVLAPWGWAAGAAMAIAYVALATRHDRTVKEEEREKIRAQLNDRGLSRLDGRWHGFPDRGERFADPDHLYAPDLDIFGQGSLFQLLNETATRLGEERLAAYLQAPGNAGAVADRQRAVQEMAPALDFRQQVLVEARFAAQVKSDPAPFVRWSESGPSLQVIAWARPFGWSLPLATLALFVLGQLELVPRWLWGAAFSGLIGIVALTRKYFSQVYEVLAAGESSFLRYHQTFSALSARSFSAPLLRGLAEKFKQDDAPSAMARFARLFGFAELRQSPQLHAVINVLSLWDIHWFFRLERWRQKYGPNVRGWFEALAELEALFCISTLAHDHPEYAYPQVDAGGPHFVAQGLGHPLLAQAIRNDVALPGPAHALIVTGSNMSGKSTLLRAMGVNAVLALAGSPVCAEVLSLAELKVLTSMRIKDSLERGISYFYAEVKRMKEVLDMAKAAGGRAMFLLDEILLGTNARERQIASRQIVRLLLQTGAIGAIATHDLSLASLEQESAVSVRNIHFRDQLLDGRMAFDYRIHEGVVQGSNALRLLRAVGIDVGE